MSAEGKEWKEDERKEEREIDKKQWMRQEKGSRWRFEERK